MAKIGQTKVDSFAIDQAGFYKDQVSYAAGQIVGSGNSLSWRISNIGWMFYCVKGLVKELAAAYKSLTRTRTAVRRTK